MLKTLTPNPAMAQFADCLLRLNRFIAAGHGDDATADAVRDEMDSICHELTPVEDLLLRGLSADLYSIGELSPSSPAICESDISAIKSAERAEDWPGVLRQLRDSKLTLATHYVQFMRGVCWAHLGQLDVAIAFLHDALRLAPEEPTIRVWLLTVLVQAKHFDEAVGLATAGNSSSKDVDLMLKSAIVLFVAAEQPALNSETAHRNAIEWADRAIAAAEAAPLSDSTRHSLYSVYLHKGLSHDQLAQADLARQACEEAIRHLPQELTARLLQDWLRRHEPDAAIDFRRDLGQSIVRNDFLALSSQFDATDSLPIPN